MNDLYYNIIIIVLVLVLFLAYILIAYFYTSYSNYKGDVDDNFEKTKNYINTSFSKIDDNIRSSITENNNKINNTSNYINEINKKVSRVELKSEDNYNENKKSINNFNLDLNNTKSQLSSNGENLNKFDTNIKQFIQFKSNGTTINEAIYKYQFIFKLHFHFYLTHCHVCQIFLILFQNYSLISIYSYFLALNACFVDSLKAVFLFLIIF
jgi:predicted PurR-regulated permease PerM